MATTIQNLHSLTAGNQPGDLLPGEVAYNLADGYVYLGNGSNNYTNTLGQVIGPSTAPGGGWQQAVYNSGPVPGAVTLAGTYDASVNEVITVTAAGTTAGFTAGGALPAAAAGNADLYLLVQHAGTLTPPAPAGDANPGDWLVSTGSAWSLVEYSSTVIPASNVTLTPGGDITATDVQTALTVQLPLIYTTMADGVVSQLQCNGNANVYGNTTLGDTSADTLTVAATSTFVAPVALNSGATVTGNVVASGNVNATGLTLTGGATVGGNLGVTGTVSGGAATFNGITSSANATIAGSLTAANASVTGSTTIGTSASTTDNLLVWANSTFQTPVAFNNAVSFTNSANFSGANTTFTVGSTSTLAVSGKLTVVDASTSTINGSAFANQLIPIGGIMIWPAAAIPTAPGFVRCDGTALSRTTYAALFAILGTTYGAGDGSTTFNVPDFRGVFLRGYGQNGIVNNAAGTKAGSATRAVGTGQTDAFASHNHNMVDSSGNSINANWRNLTDSINAGGSSGLTSGGNVNYGLPRVSNTGGAETNPVNVAVSYLIRVL
jgi:microcystin-dependent protein